VVLGSGEYRLVVAVEGSMEVSIADDARTTSQGSAIAISAREGDATISAPGLAIAVLAPASAERVPPSGLAQGMAESGRRRWSGALVPVETLPSACVVTLPSLA